MSIDGFKTQTKTKQPFSNSAHLVTFIWAHVTEIANISSVTRRFQVYYDPPSYSQLTHN